MDNLGHWREHVGHRLEVMAGDEVAEGVICVTCGEYVWEADDEDDPATTRGAVSAERWNIAIWDDGTIAGIYPVSGPQPAPRSDMRIVEVAPVNPQAGAVSADLPEVERLRKASDEVIGHLVARVEQLEAALRQIGEMAGAKANGKDARAMGKAAREALRS